MKIEAKRHPTLMSSCIYVGQFSHQITSRLNVLASGYKILGIKPLPEDEALSRGVNFLSEAFVFLVGGGIIIVEYSRSEAKNALKAEQTAQKEADLLQRLTDIEFKLSLLKNTSFEDGTNSEEDKLFDLDKRLQTVEKAASYWAMSEMSSELKSSHIHVNSNPTQKVESSSSPSSSLAAIPQISQILDEPRHDSDQISDQPTATISGSYWSTSSFVDNWLSWWSSPPK